MIKLFLDIETIPCEEEKREEFSNIIKNKAKATEISDEDAFLRTGLEGTFGRICCIGFIKESGSLITKGVISGNEKDILTQFWEISNNVTLFVGHNIFDFDLPFIYKRSVILGVKPRLDLSFAKYRNNPIFDTQCEWEKWSYNRQKLDTLAKVLNLPTSKDEIDGSQVWTYFKEGKLDAICKYCLKDVELVRKIYYRMIFEDMPQNV